MNDHEEDPVRSHLHDYAVWCNPMSLGNSLASCSASCSASRRETSWPRKCFPGTFIIGSECFESPGVPGCRGENAFFNTKPWKKPQNITKSCFFTYKKYISSMLSFIFLKTEAPFCGTQKRNMFQSLETFWNCLKTKASFFSSVWNFFETFLKLFKRFF